MRLINVLFLLFLFQSYNGFGQNNAEYSDAYLDSVLNNQLSKNKRKFTSIQDISRVLNLETQNAFLQYSLLAKWVVNNLSYKEEAKNDLSLNRAIKKGEGVCYHYAMIFDSLSKYLNFDSYYITGHVKEYTNDGNIKMVYHAWNAVKIEGSILMSDLTWSDDQEVLIGKNKTNSKESKLSRDFFMISPEKFILSHFPVDKKHRFTKYAYRKFKRTPIVDRGFLVLDNFFNHNIDLNNFFKENDLSISLTKKTTSINSIEIIGFELLPCSNCSELTEVIKFERNDHLSFHVNKVDILSIVKNTPVILLLIYREFDNDDETVVPVIQFIWQ